MQYISREELERRWARVRRFMDSDALVVLQNVDQFYLTGTFQNGVLWFPREGEPVFAVRKSFHRARTESPLQNIVPLKSFSDLPGIITSPGEVLGFELDVVPVAVYQQVSRLFPKSRIVDGARPIREARAVKTPYEVECIRKAGQILDKAFLDIPTQLHEGLAEYELAARIEYVMRMEGHQGVCRVRRFNMELFYGAVSFGETAAYPHNFDGPVGMRGLYPAAQVMGGRRQLKRGEPVMVDVVGGYEGYLADGSRTYALGSVSQTMRDTYEFIVDLNGWIETQLRPGAIPSEIN
jgi:Xaa-Pro aminopeptidase